MTFLMSDAEVCEVERDLGIELFTVEDLKPYTDSLQYISDVPYIQNCEIPLFWKIVGKGHSMVPLLIDKLTDTTVLENTNVRFWGGNFTVADMALVVLQEIFADIPIYELMGIDLSADCGSCAYWDYVRNNNKNRKVFQKAFRRWYDSIKENLIWEESYSSLTGDCFKGGDVKGHYRVHNSAELDKPN